MKMGIRRGEEWGKRWGCGLAFVVWLATNLAGGAEVDLATAKQALQGWLNEGQIRLGERFVRKTADAAEWQTVNDAVGRTLYHVANLTDGGYVILAGDDRVIPVVAFSDKGSFLPQMDNPLHDILQADLPARRAELESDTSLRNAPCTRQIQGRSPAGQHWQKLLSLGQSAATARPTQSLTEIDDLRCAPLLKSKWSQCTKVKIDTDWVYVYEYYTPNHYPCGCVNVATAQIMRYWQYPTRGVGLNASTVYVDYTPTVLSTRGGDGAGGPYRWDLMDLEPDASISEASCQAISALCFDIGLSFGTFYAPDGSGTKLFPDKLKNRFFYASANGLSVGGGQYNDKVFQAIYSNLDAHLPVYLAVNGFLSGHGVVADGYGYQGALYTHINLGWGGYENAWYNLTTEAIDPGVYRFTGVTDIGYNIRPAGEGEIVSGRVLDETGRPVGGMKILAQGDAYAASTVSAANGVYAFDCVPSNLELRLTAVRNDGTVFQSLRAKTGLSSSDWRVNACGNLWGVDFGPSPITVTAQDANASAVGLYSGTFIIARSGLGLPQDDLTVNFILGGTAGNGDYLASATSSVTIPCNLHSATVTITPLAGAAVEGGKNVTLTLAPGSGYSLGSPASATVVLCASHGLVAAWGSDDHCQLGDEKIANQLTPQVVPHLFNVTAIASGYNHSLVLLADGTVKAWGDNSHGQLGDGTGTNRPTPVLIPGLSGVTATATSRAADSIHSLALLADGTVKAWGKNNNGQLGDGTRQDRLVPTLIPGLAGVTAIAVGDGFSLAVLADGTVKAWGDNYFGQLGDSTTENRDSPVLVPGLSGATAVAAGSRHSLALLADGTVKSWGYNSSGQLGDDTTQARLTPVAVSGLSGATAIAAGLYTSMVLLTDGTVRVWGYCHFWIDGAHGYTSHTPLAITELSNVVAVQAGVFHNLALLADGTVKTWGTNGCGQLGDGTTTNRVKPVLVAGLKGAYAIAGGGQFSLALFRDLPEVTVTANDALAAETGSDAGSFTVARTGSTALALTVNFALSGTAGSGDYIASASTAVTIPAGSSTASVTLTPIFDDLSEGSEIAILSLQACSDYRVGSPASAMLTIADAIDRPAVTVTVVAGDVLASETGPDTGEFTISRTGSTAAALTVHFSLSGTTDSGDYSASATTDPTIPAGCASICVVITPLADQLVEGDETVVLTLTTGAGYTLGSPASTTVTIADADAIDPNDHVAQFIARFYQVCLQRQPDAAGLREWVANLKSGAATGANAAAGFICSREFQARNLDDSAWLEALYQAIFGRAADETGKNDWLTRLYAGTSRTTVLDGFVQAREFGELCARYGIASGQGGSDQVSAFVARFYRLCLQREPDTTGLAAWKQNLQSQTCTGADVATGFVFSAEFQARSLAGDAFLDVLYQAVFGRAADAAGKNGWLEQLSAGTSRQIVVAGFIHGAEFSALCNQYGIRAY